MCVHRYPVRTPTEEATRVIGNGVLRIERRVEPVGGKGVSEII